MSQQHWPYAGSGEAGVAKTKGFQTSILAQTCGENRCTPVDLVRINRSNMRTQGFDSKQFLADEP